MPAPKKSRKRYFQGSGSKKKRNKWGVNPAANVQPGSPMVLITCDESKEKRAVQEVLSWMSSMADQWYPPAPSPASEKAITRTQTKEEKDGKPSSNMSADFNIADELESELQALRDQKAPQRGEGKEGEGGKGEQRFVVDHMDGKAMHLIRVVDKSIPISQFVTRLMRHTLTTKHQETRFTHKILPMSHTCLSSMENLKKIAREAIDQFFAPEKETAKKAETKNSTFAVMYKTRGSKNQKMDRMDVINAVVDCMPEGFSVNLDNPDVSVLVQVIGRLTGVAVVAGFNSLSGFNIRTLLASTKTPETS